MIKQILRNKKSLRLFFTTGYMILSFSYLIILLLGIGLIPKLESVTKIIQNNINLVFWLMLITIFLETVFFLMSQYCDNLYLEEIVDTIARARENIERSTSSDIEKAKTTIEEIKEKSECFNKESLKLLSDAERQGVKIDFEITSINHDIKYLQSRLNDE